MDAGWNMSKVLNESIAGTYPAFVIGWTWVRKSITEFGPIKSGTQTRAHVSWSRLTPPDANC